MPKRIERNSAMTRKTVGRLCRKRRGVEVKGCLLSFIKNSALILCTMAGIVVGFCVGLGLHALKGSRDALLYIGLPGELYLRGLKATIVPIVICMTITATSSVDVKKNGRIAGVTVAVFGVTHLIATTTAAAMFLLLRPDANSLNTGELQEKVESRLHTQDVLLDLLRNLVPDNIVAATFSTSLTEYTPEKEEEEETETEAENLEITNGTLGYTRTLGSTSGVNILGIMAVSFVIGAAANKKLAQDSAFLVFFRQAQEVILLVMHWLVWFTPVGVASLLAQSIAGVSNLGSVFYALSRLVICVVSSLVIHQVVTMPLLLYTFTRENPFLFVARCSKAFFVGFAACGTAVALPHMLEAGRENQVSTTVSRFVIPLSVTLHADASALYMASAAMFLAQATGETNVALTTVFVIVCLTTVLGFTIPPVPSSSIINVVIILTALGFPLRGVALLFTMEWILDRIRTGVNATSHVMCAGITDAICGRQGMDPLPTTSDGEDWEVEDAVKEHPVNLCRSKAVNCSHGETGVIDEDLDNESEFR